MAEELDQKLNESGDGNRAEARIKQLSDKVELTAKERDEKDKLLKETSEKLASLEKENTFNSSFADILGSNPAAKDHKDEIKAKVLAGYSVEDAAISVLAKAGKYQPQQQERVSPTGGSAPTPITIGSEKKVSDMTREEKRAALIEAERQGIIGLN